MCKAFSHRTPTFFSSTFTPGIIEWFELGLGSNPKAHLVPTSLLWAGMPH